MSADAFGARGASRGQAPGGALSVAAGRARRSRPHDHHRRRDLQPGGQLRPHPRVRPPGSEFLGVPVPRAGGGRSSSAIHYLVGATWSVAVRRIADAFASFVPVAMLLFIVVAVGIPHLYIWSSRRDAGSGGEAHREGRLPLHEFLHRTEPLLPRSLVLLSPGISCGTRRGRTRPRDPALTPEESQALRVFIRDVRAPRSLLAASTCSCRSSRPGTAPSSGVRHGGRAVAGRALRRSPSWRVILRRPGGAPGESRTAPHYHDLDARVRVRGVLD